MWSQAGFHEILAADCDPRVVCRQPACERGLQAPGQIPCDVHTQWACSCMQLGTRGMLRRQRWTRRCHRWSEMCPSGARLPRDPLRKTWSAHGRIRMIRKVRCTSPMAPHSGVRSTNPRSEKCCGGCGAAERCLQAACAEARLLLPRRGCCMCRDLLMGFHCRSARETQDGAADVDTLCTLWRRRPVPGRNAHSSGAMNARIL